LPICTLAAATAGSPLLGVVLEIGSHGRDIDMLRGRFDGDETCRGAVLQGLEAADRHANCVRVFRYSTVDFSDSSIAPTASAHIAMRASSTHALDQRDAFSGSPIVASAPTSTPVKVMSAACKPSWSDSRFRDVPGVAGNQKHADAAGVALATLGACGHDQGVGVSREHHEFSRRR